MDSILFLSYWQFKRVNSAPSSRPWSFNTINSLNSNAASQSKTWRDLWLHSNPNLWVIISRETASSETKLKNEAKHDKENKINTTQLNYIALTIYCAACSFQFQRHFFVRHLFIWSRSEWMFLHLFYFVFISGENKAKKASWMRSEWTIRTLFLALKSQRQRQDMPQLIFLLKESFSHWLIFASKGNLRNEWK